MKTTLLLAICIALFFTGGMANAFFSTCPMNMDKSSAEMQMDADMPCHETEDSENRSSEQCDGCDCQHCVQINALPVEELKDHHEGAAVGILAGQLRSSRQIETHFRPPKHIS
ncbi:MAG: hypothetical protein OXH71_00235 [Candidatus Dadabacteria bacterium]|nr:hypothetical protein [Candidatus Dadabacteria bacterium]MDE0519129.1 hypothetical protein [Candidatus Dadabacteria bacterium]MDE0662315.1 hypothetical protein [Candidatus Dadabacteria bacterium]